MSRPKLYRNYPGFAAKMRKEGKKRLTRNRVRLGMLKHLTILYRERYPEAYKECARNYPLLIQYRLAKCLHRNKLLT